MRKPRKNYDDEFKRQIIARLNQGGVTQLSLAREFGVNDNLIGRWKKEAEEQTGWARSEATKSRDLEMAKKDKMIRQLQTENDFLKKASAYFARLVK